MDRRTFLGNLACRIAAASLAAPRATEAQQAGKVYRLGFVSGFSAAGAQAVRAILVAST